MARIAREKFEGCLIGQCLGDALGFPVEGYPPTICDRYVKQVLQAGMPSVWTHYPYEFGQYSDDSQLARELIQSLVTRQAFDPADYAKRVALLFKHEKIVKPGQATQAAAQRLLQGVPWNEAGTLPPSAGNGSAMRAAPLGLFYYDHTDALLAHSREQSLITHQDPRCAGGAAAIAGAVSLALTQESIAPAAFLGQLAEWTAPLSLAMAEPIRLLAGWLDLSPEEAEPLISRAGMETEYETQWHGISPFVISSVLWSLYAFLRTPEDYWETICTAIAVGGDVDTTAAMAGAVSGARVGLSGIPRPLAHKLTDQGAWGYDQLMALAGHLYELKQTLT